MARAPADIPAAVAQVDRAHDGRPSDAELLAAIRSGDEAAFEAVFRDYYGDLCHYASRMLDCYETAEDVVQDVLMRFWQGREQLSIRGRLTRYLYGAVRNGALMHLRRKRYFRGWEERAANGAVMPLIGQRPIQPDEWTRSIELLRAIHDAIQRLPPRCREAFLLRWEGRLSYDEIAAIMGIKRKTVEVQIHSALKSLHEQLSHWLD